jgi:hypothetical protein
MNVLIIYKEKVGEGVLDRLAANLPSIIAKELEIPGGHMAIVKPDQVSLEFCQASPRDIGADIRLMVFARSNAPRTSSENLLARGILDKVMALTLQGGEYSVDVRLYLMEIGVANHAVAG